MGILLLIVGLFIVMGGLQMVGTGLAGLALSSVFVMSSMIVGKRLFRL